MAWALLVLCFLTVVQAKTKTGPFLKTINSTTWIIGNDLWNVTQGPIYATELYYKNHDCVGEAVGHYVSYNGAASNLAWTSAEIVYRGSDYIDVSFTAAEGEMHWVVYDDLAGAYQYFVNHALPVLGEFRTLWRLDNVTFPNGRTNIKDEPLPDLKDYITKVQDETWVRPDGTYITKYDWTGFIRTIDYYGVYGDNFGSWYINPGKDYYNGDHLKQELTVHRESATGDAVQLNMLHGTHFMVSSADAFPYGKLWGPWLWYLNDGSKTDAAKREKKEFEAWPYSWFRDSTYHSRGSVSGTLRLSDGRPATGAAVFLGDNNPNETALDMGRYNYYTTYADRKGRFTIDNVLSGTYGLQAWSNGGSIADVSHSFLKNDVVVSSKKQTRLGAMTWGLPNRKQIFQVGDFDRTDLGFQYGGSPYQHALVANCPANLTFTIGESDDSEWCFAQWALGTWSISFNLDSVPSDNRTAILSVSLAGYSSGTSSSIYINGVDGTVVGNLTSGATSTNATESLANDPCLYRSATTAGEWRYFEFEFNGSSALKEGVNTVDFVCTRQTSWHGFMWDAIKLEWA